MIQEYASSLWEKSYNAVAPGSRIPEWFADQSMGCSVKVKLPSHWYNTKLLGMAVCVVVGVKGVIDPSTYPRIYFYFDDDDGHGFWLFTQMWNPIDKSTMKFDHIWFGYQSLNSLLEIYDGQLFDRRGGTMTVSFGIYGEVEKFEVRKCGVRLVYKGDETSTYCTFPHGVPLSESECSSSMEEEDESDSG